MTVDKYNKLDTIQVWRNNEKHRGSIMARTGIVLVAALYFVGLAPAIADGQFTPTAKEGYWVAASHSETAGGPLDACLTGEPHLGDFGFFILNDKSGNAQIRLINSAWTLAPNFGGNIVIAVGGHSYTLPIASNKPTEIRATIAPVQFIMLVGDLEGSSSMDVTIASSPLVTEPLDGAKDVISAFMKCNAQMNPPPPGLLDGD